MNDLISVIVPVYKVENYLHKCVDSIINQTYKNLEIILVDDESPDNCPKICDDYAKRDSRIKVIHKKNGGLSSARNAGLDIAKGKYIEFVDSDDYIDIEMISVLYNLLIQNQADMSICSLQYVGENEKKLTNPKVNLKDCVLDNKKLLQKLYEDGSVYYVVACNKLYNSSLFEGIRYPIGKIHEDEAIIHDIFLRCKKVAVTSLRYYMYYQRGNSIMHEKNVNSLIKYTFWADRLLKLHKMINRENLVYGMNLFWTDFFEDYYTCEDNKYKRSMKTSLFRILPLIIKYHTSSTKEVISLFIFLISSKLYYILFKKGNDM